MLPSWNIHGPEYAPELTKGTDKLRFEVVGLRS